MIVKEHTKEQVEQIVDTHVNRLRECVQEAWERWRASDPSERRTAVIVGAVVIWTVSSGGSESKPLLITATAQPRDLRDEVTVQGTVERAEQLKAADKAKARDRKNKEKQFLKDAFSADSEASEEELERRRQKLKTLIKLGKDRGFLTHSEINDHLPENIIDPEAIEGIIGTFNDMGIAVYEHAPDAEALLLSDNVATVANDDDADAAAEAALQTVDSDFGRTTDPVRMYMREMGSVELLTREGEIEIAKRIEGGLKDMVQAISACPMTISEILALAERIEKDESKVDEVVDGLVDPNAPDDAPIPPAPIKSAAADEDDEEGDEDEEEEFDEEDAAQ